VDADGKKSRAVVLKAGSQPAAAKALEPAK